MNTFASRIQLLAALVALALMSSQDVLAQSLEVLAQSNIADLLSHAPGGEDYEFGIHCDVDGDVAVVAAANIASSGVTHVHVFERQAGRWTRVARLWPSNPGVPSAGYNFGRYVCISGDVIVVSRFDANANQGAAYVYQRPPGGWADMTETAILTPSDGQPGDKFGKACIDGDIIAIGAPYHDNGLALNKDHGAVYVFVRPETGWVSTTQTAKLTEQPLLVGAMLGEAIAMEGAVIISTSPGAGRIRVFQQPQNGWSNSSPVASLKGFGTSSAGGRSIAIQNDVILGTGLNGVVVFVRQGPSWTSMAPTAELTSSGPSTEAVSDPYSIDGDWIAARAPNADNGVPGSDQGAVCLFRKPAGGWVSATETAKLTPLAATADEGQGGALKLQQGVLYVGVPRADGITPNEGRVDIYEEPESGWMDMHQTETLSLSTEGDISRFDFFGETIAIDGDTAVVSCVGDDTYCKDHGAAFVFQRVDGTWQRKAKLLPSNPIPGLSFGSKVAVHGDEVLIACSTHSNPPAYLFQKPSDGWKDMTETAMLSNSAGGPEDSDRAVALGDGIAVIGAPEFENEGALFLFVKQSEGWRNSGNPFILRADDGGMRFDVGKSVAISGDVIVAGAPGAIVDSLRSGKAYVFEQPPGGWASMTSTSELTAAAPQEDAEFGAAVAIKGSLIVIGEPYRAPATGIGRGAAYLFERDRDGWKSKTPTCALSPVQPAATEASSFGAGVAISERNVLICAKRDSNVNGLGYLFVLPTEIPGSMTEIARLRSQQSHVRESFGSAVAIEGNQVLVGASWRSNEWGPNVGGAWTFDLNLGDCNNNNLPDIVDIASHTSEDVNGDGVPDECQTAPCPSDIAPTGSPDLVVNVADLLAVITSWGPCDSPCPPACVADIVPDCAVNVGDLLAVITHWGACP